MSKLNVKRITAIDKNNTCYYKRINRERSTQNILCKQQRTRKMLQLKQENSHMLVPKHVIFRLPYMYVYV